MFLLSSLVTGTSFKSILSLVLEFWQFLFIRDWPEIWKSEIPPSEFCSLSGDWGKLRTPSLVRTSLIKCYWMLQNARVTAFTVSELLRENQQGWGGGGGWSYPSHTHPDSQIRVKKTMKISLFNHDLFWS